MKNYVQLFLMFLFALPLSAGAENVNLNFGQLSRQVVKVIADSSNGRVSMGSGVIVENNQVATNCHITRPAKRVIVFKDQTRFTATSQVIAPELDLCVLHTTGMDMDPAFVGSVNSVHLEDTIYIAGYPHAGGLSLLRGRITGLHPYENSQVIETDAGFIQGSSGGALFNRYGQLIGLTTFLSTAENNRRYFAIPIDWLQVVAKHHNTNISPYRTKAFWERGVVFKPGAISYRQPG